MLGVFCLNWHLCVYAFSHLTSLWFFCRSWRNVVGFFSEATTTNELPLKCTCIRCHNLPFLGKGDWIFLRSNYDKWIAIKMYVFTTVCRHLSSSYARFTCEGVLILATPLCSPRALRLEDEFKMSSARNTCALALWCFWHVELILTLSLYLIMRLGHIRIKNTQGRS
jgi:hypothetical protein